MRAFAVLLAAAAAAAASAEAAEAAAAAGLCPDGCNGNGWWNATGGGTCEACVSGFLSPDACCLMPCNVSAAGQCDAIDGMAPGRSGDADVCKCPPFGNMLLGELSRNDPRLQCCGSLVQLNSLSSTTLGPPAVLGGDALGTGAAGGSLMAVRMCASCDLPLVGLAHGRGIPSETAVLELVQFTVYEGIHGVEPPRPLQQLRAEIPFVFGTDERGGFPSYYSAFAVSEPAATALVAVTLNGTAAGLAAAALGGPGGGLGRTPVRTATFAFGGNGTDDDVWQVAGVVAGPDASHAFVAGASAAGEFQLHRVELPSLESAPVVSANPTAGGGPNALLFQSISCADAAVAGVWYCASSSAAVVGFDLAAGRVAVSTAVFTPSVGETFSVLSPIAPLVALPDPRGDASCRGGRGAWVTLPTALLRETTFGVVLRIDACPDGGGSATYGSEAAREINVGQATNQPHVLSSTYGTGVLYVFSGLDAWAVRLSDMSTLGVSSWSADAALHAAVPGLASVKLRTSAGVMGVVALGELGRAVAAPVTDAVATALVPASHLVFLSLEHPRYSIWRDPRANHSFNAVIPATLNGCGPGSTAGAFRCERAPPGQYVATRSNFGVGKFNVVERSLRPCPAGTHSLGGADGIRECVPCEPGTYQPEKGQGACLPCPGGKYCPLGSALALPLAAGPDGGPAVRTSLPPSSSAGGGGELGAVGPEVNGLSPSLWLVALALSAAGALVLMVAAEALWPPHAPSTHPCLARARALLERVDCCYTRRHWTAKDEVVRVRTTSLGGSFSVAAALVAVSACALLLHDYVNSNQVRSTSLSTVHLVAGDPGASGDIEAVLSLTGGGESGLCPVYDNSTTDPGEWSAELCGALGGQRFFRGPLGLTGVVIGVISDGSTTECRQRDGGARCEVRWRCPNCLGRAQVQLVFTSQAPGAWVSSANWTLSTPSVFGGGDLELHGRYVTENELDADAVRGLFVPRIRVSPAALHDRVHGVHREAFDLTFLGEEVTGQVGGGDEFWPDAAVDMASGGGAVPAGAGIGMVFSLEQNNVKATTVVARRSSVLSLLSAMSGAVFGVIGFCGVLLVTFERSLSEITARRNARGGGGGGGGGGDGGGDGGDDGCDETPRGGDLDEPLLRHRQQQQGPSSPVQLEDRSGSV